MRSRVVPPVIGHRHGEPERREGVVGSSRERVLGGKPIVHRQHRDPGVRGQEPAGAVGAVQAADHEPAAVVVDQQPVGVALVRDVQPPPDVARRRGDA